MPVDSTVSDLDDLIAASRTVRRRFEGDAYLNLAFYAGQQWARWDGNQVFPVALDDGREMVVDNRVRPFVRTEIAKMTKTRPKFVAVPKSQADQDIAAARYAEQALDDAWKRQNLHRKLRQALLWARITGAGFWKVWWDPGRGPKNDVLVYGDGHPSQGRVVRDKFGAPLKPDLAHTLPQEADPQQRTVAMGDLCVELRSFFHLFPDPLAGEEGIDAAEWIGEEAVFSRDYCARHFPQHMDELKFDADPNPGAVESRMPLGGLYDSGTTQAGKGIKLREYWSKDKHCIWTTDGLVLLEESNPYPWLPYVMFRGVPVPGRFWPDAVVTDLRPRQVDLNKRLSQIAENAERIANPPFLVPSSLGDDFEWYGLPGERVEYQDTGSPTAEPHFMNVPEIPAYVQNDVDRIQQSMMEISGNHEVSSAQVPTGVTAASAISLLQEQDDTRLGPDVNDMEQAVGDAGKRMNWLMFTYYTDKRHLAIAGEGGRWDVQAYKGSQLGVQDIDVQAGSGMPQSKAAKQAAIQQFATLFSQNNPGSLTPRDWHRVMEDIDVGGLEHFFATISKDERQVADENRRLESGEQLQINSFDDDPAHIEFHTEFQKTSHYADLVRQDPRIGQNFEQHVEAHRMRQAMQNQSLAPPGVPPGLMAPSGPQDQQPQVPSMPPMPSAPNGAPSR